RPNDKTVRRLVLARLGALGTLAPGGRPVLATLGAPAVGMVDRVHGDRAHGRARTPPARATRLAGRLVHMVGVRHGADRCHAVGPHAARLAGVEAQNGPARVAADQLTVGACRARNLAAPAGLKLDVVHDGADRHGSKLHRVAGLHVGLDTRDHHVADTQALRRQNIRQGGVLIFEQRDESGAVGIVFQPLDHCRHVVLYAPEIDAPIGLLVPTTDVARGDTAVVVAAAGLELAFGQHFDRRALPQTFAVDQDQLAQAGR